MRISVLPKTSLGWWSFGLAITFLVALVFLLRSASVANNPSGELFGNTFQDVLNMVIYYTFLGAFVTGLVGVIVKRERSLLVFTGIIICIAAFVMLWVMPPD